MDHPTRVAWDETKEGERCHIIAELVDETWKFSEQYQGEVRYFPLQSTPPLVEKAQQLAQEQLLSTRA